MSKLEHLKALCEKAIAIQDESKKNNEGLGMYGLSQAYQSLSENLKPYRNATAPVEVLKLLSIVEIQSSALKEINDTYGVCGVAREALTAVDGILGE
jgi:hypothetical protein